MVIYGRIFGFPGFPRISPDSRAPPGPKSMKTMCFFVQSTWDTIFLDKYYWHFGQMQIHVKIGKVIKLKVIRFKRALERFFKLQKDTLYWVLFSNWSESFRCYVMSGLYQPIRVKVYIARQIHPSKSFVLHPSFEKHMFFPTFCNVLTEIYSVRYTPGKSGWNRKHGL